MRPARGCFSWATTRRWLQWSALAALLLAGTGHAAETFGVEPEEEIPPLRPPRPEMPPTFWEANRGWVIGGSAALVVVISAGIWWLRRPARVTPVPPEVRARQELAPLRGQPETGEVLSRVSQIVRRYVSTAFDLHQGELTTADLARAMTARQETIGAQLANNIAGFLRVCDERKFAPPAQRPPLGAADEAGKLVETVEARRAELREAEARARQATTNNG